MLSSPAISSDLEALHPTDIVRWAVDQFGLEQLVVTASFGDAVLAHVVSQAAPGIEVVLLDTQFLFAETQWFANEIANRFDLNLRIVRPNTVTLSDNLWATDTNACCQARKVEPLNRALEGKSAWISGLRRADSDTRANTPVTSFDIVRNVVKVNPLAAMSDADVELYHSLYELPEHPLADRGYASIGCWPCTRPVAEGEDKRAGRWSGHTKTECGIHL